MSASKLEKMRKAEWFRAATIRAIKTVVETLISTIPAGFVITPAMIEHFEIGYLYIIAAWLATGILSGLIAFATCIPGLPEVDDTKIYYRHYKEKGDDIEVEEAKEK